MVHICEITTVITSKYPEYTKIHSFLKCISVCIQKLFKINLTTNLNPKSCSRPCPNLGHVAQFVLTLGHLWRYLNMVLTPKL